MSTLARRARARRMDEDMLAIDAGDIELERRFDSYARARLSPDPRATARVRARVMREARLQLEAARIAAYVAPAVRASRVSAVRRLAMPLLAAGLWLAIAVGTLAASQAGGPLYASRLWIEAATLPAPGGARVEADLARLDDRISEALSAASTRNLGAVAAALEAYVATADDARTSALAEATLVARVQEALGRHQAVLTALLAGLGGNANGSAADAIERNLQRAIEHNAAVLQTIGDHAGGGAGAGSTNGAGAGSGAGAGGSDTGSPAGGGSGGAGPAAGGGSGGGTPDGTPAAAGNGGDGAGGAGSGGGTSGGGTSAGGQVRPSAVPEANPEHSPRGGG